MLIESVLSSLADGREDLSEILDYNHCNFSRTVGEGVVCVNEQYRFMQVENI